MMLKVLAVSILVALALAGVFAPWIAPYPYEFQDREAPSLAPSAQHWLGTDDLGRDRWSRFLYGTRISLTLAPAAALLTLLVAVLVGVAAGVAGGWVEQMLLAATDLFASMPWLFLLLIIRAALPLNVPAWTSVGITFAMLGLVGWTAAARVVRTAVRAAQDDGFLLQARAMGANATRIWFRHFLPNLRPILLAQFWISIPLFVLSEANLGLLGLGVAEPLPSWGNLLFELTSHREVAEAPWLLAPAVALVVTLLAMQRLSREPFAPQGQEGIR
ncbi:MAG: ABC transporter permease [Acidobacteria bacterium]|nr:ABC transporter permease [Acidobacteriota bacterium]